MLPGPRCRGLTTMRTLLTGNKQESKCLMVYPDGQHTLAFFIKCCHSCQAHLNSPIFRLKQTSISVRNHTTFLFERSINICMKFTKRANRSLYQILRAAMSHHQTNRLIVIMRRMRRGIRSILYS